MLERGYVEVFEGQEQQVCSLQGFKITLILIFHFIFWDEGCALPFPQVFLFIYFARRYMK